MSEIGHRVRMARIEKGLTQQQLAFMIDAAQGFVSMIESGDRLPSLGTLAALSNALNVDVSYLMEPLTTEIHHG